MSDEKIKLPKIKLKKQPRKIKIQTLEEYLVENKIPPAKPDITGFPDLFAPKLNKKKRDDVPSKVPSIKGTAGINLYASLLVAIAEKGQKETEEENQVDEEDENE